MNTELFGAYLIITLLLMLTPGPIVTLVIATGARDGVRPALVTVAGTMLGNAILIGGGVWLSLARRPV
jgi:threonine/homoserine/homoserine lactone efflux protein